jgi:hypothetical protein
MKKEGIALEIEVFVSARYYLRLLVNELSVLVLYSYASKPLRSSVAADMRRSNSAFIILLVSCYA